MKIGRLGCLNHGKKETEIDINIKRLYDLEGKLVGFRQLTTGKKDRLAPYQ